MRSAAVALLVSAAPTLAQFPAEPVGLKVLESRFGDGVKITFKEVRTILEIYYCSFLTTNPRTRSVKPHLV
jgi:hypothetical protein